MRLYTFGSTRKTDGHLTSHGYRRDTARAQSENVGPPRGHRTGSLQFPLKVVETLRFPYDRRTVLMTRKFEESQNMKSYDAHMNRKHLHRSPLSPTMSKFLGKSQTEKSFNYRGKCYLVDMTRCGLPTIAVRFLSSNCYTKIVR